MITNNHGLQFIDFIKIREQDLRRYDPIAGSFAILACEEKYLLCYNTYRKQWELPAGRRENGETPKDCAIRELFEETGQKVGDMQFKGLLKVKKMQQRTIKYNPVYFKEITELQPFRENDETTAIILWDQQQPLNFVDPVDLQILNYLK